MKIIALVHGEPEQLPVAKTDRDPDLYDKLVAFRKDVCTNRLVRFWKSATELPGLVALNLPKTIKAYPAIGWVRGDSVTSNEALTELLSLKQENESLRREIDQLTAKQKYNIPNIAGLEYPYEISGGGNNYLTDQARSIKKSMTFGDVFKILSPIIVAQKDDRFVKEYLAKEIFNFVYSIIDNQCFQTIKFQFDALGLIELTEVAGRLFWTLTPLGKQTAIEAIVIKES